MAGLIAVTVEGAKDLGGLDIVWNIAHNGGRIFFLEYGILTSWLYTVKNLKAPIQLFILQAITSENTIKLKKTLSVLLLQKMSYLVTLLERRYVWLI